MHNFFAFIQARTNSSRFPNKVLEKIGDKNLIEHILFRLEQIIERDKIVLLIPENDSILKDFAVQNKILFFEGSEEDVRSRFIEAGKKFKAEFIIRLTADNPFVDIEYIEALVNCFKNPKVDIASFQGLPIGMGVEAFKLSSIMKEPKTGLRKEHLEHVSLHLKENNEFHFVKLNSFIQDEKFDSKNIRLTIDKEKDLELCKIVYSKIKNPLFGFIEVLNLYKENPNLFNLNSEVSQVSFSTTPILKNTNKIFILSANPKTDGTGHFERCKILSVLLESNGYEVEIDFQFNLKNKYSFYIIDSRDILVPKEIRNEKILLIDNFGADRLIFPHFDSLPNILNEFEEVLNHSLLTPQIKYYKDILPKRKVLCYAGSLSFKDSYRLDKFIISHFGDLNYELIRIGGKKRKKKNLKITVFDFLNKSKYLKHLSDSEFFISYFGQSVIEASFLKKKIIIYSISNYHDDLSFHFVQNSNAMYAGSLNRNKLILNANFEKYTRQNDLNINEYGFEVLLETILDYMRNI